MKLTVFKSSIAFGISLFLHTAAATETVVSPFVPLSCNARIGKVKCELWSDRFGVRTSFSNLIIIPCGVCVTMDQRINDSTLTFDDGLDIRGKLVIPDGISLQVITPMIVVQGELQMYSTKTAVNGIPTIHILLKGQNERQTYTAVDENSKKCTNDGTVTPNCEAGKKSITVAGGKVLSKCLEREPVPVRCCTTPC
jgi:hypothetical protein